MSHSSGEVWVNGSRLGWFEYNGTADLVMPRIFLTQDELCDNWRNDHAQPWGEKCGCDKTAAIVVSHYGSVNAWEAEVCVPCMRICGPLNPYEDETRWVTRSDPRFPPGQEGEP